MTGTSTVWRTVIVDPPPELPKRERYLLEMVLIQLGFIFFVVCPLASSSQQASVTLPDCGTSRINRQVSARIVGGRDANRGEYPWQASLRRNESSEFKHLCGGVILNRNWIICASHCFINHTEEDFEIVVGLHKLSDPSAPASVHQISKIMRHPDFTMESISNDIALLKMDPPLDIDGSNGYMNGVCLPKPFDDATGTATITGWGRLVENGSLADTLQSAEVPILENSVCEDLFEIQNDTEDDDYITDSKICAGAGGTDACNYDSGGPMIQYKNGRAVLVGIISFGDGCARPGNPAVYTRVSHFVEWIQRNALSPTHTR